jgi:glycosyltransferase involved in cell wall biosynthesis
MTRVTIAIPTYNREDLLSQAIDSALAQTHSDIEVIVADNASTDGTADRVSAIDDERVVYAPTTENVGFAANHLRCLGLGSGELITILQDDDLLDPASVERRVAMFDSDPAVGMVHSAFRVADVELRPIEGTANWDGSDTDVVRDGREFLHRTFGDGRRSHLSASLYRRAALPAEQLGLRDAEAFELALSLEVALRRNVGFIAEPLGTIRYHPAQHAVGAGVATADGAFERTHVQIALFREVSARFVERHRDELDTESDALLDASLRWVRHELRRQVVRDLPDHPAPTTAWRKLREASAVEPSLLRDPKTVSVLANASLAAPARARLAELMRTARRRLRRAHVSAGGH